MGRGRRPRTRTNRYERPGDSASPALSTGYHLWTTSRVGARGLDLEVVTKPGVPGHGELDPATGLLLDHLEIDAGEMLLDLQCGAGAVSAFACRSAAGSRAILFDRNLIAVEAARRTLAANGVEQADVHFATAPRPGSVTADVACIRLPLGRLPTLELLWAAFESLKPGGRCYLAGANDEGIRTAMRQLEEIFGGAEALGYRGGNRIGLATRPESQPDSAGKHAIPWSDPDRFHRFTAHTPDGELEIASRPGVFSWDRVDGGSASLMAAMEIAEGESVLELGCGFGLVGMVAALRSRTGNVVMVDVDSEAVRSATRSVALNGLEDRVEVIASDVGGEVANRRFNVVVANPPFHLQKRTNLEIPAQFIRDAATVLEPGGRLYLVANRTLPYERWLEESFGSYSVASDGREFKVLTATRAPQSAARAR